MRLRALLAPALVLALAAADCGGGGSGSTPSRASTSQSTAKPANGKAGKRAPAPAASAKAPPDAYAGSRRLPFGAAPLSAAQRSRLGGSGKVTIPVHVDRAGTVSAFGQAELEGAIRRVAQAAPVQASGPGVVDLTLRLTPRARRHLRRGAGSILMFVGLFFSKSRTAQRLAVRLKG